MSRSCFVGGAFIAALVVGCERPAPPEEPGAGKGASAERKLVLSKAARERAKVTLGAARRERLVGGLRVPAEVRLDLHRTAHVTAIVSGQVQKLEAFRGDHVKKGQVLARLHSVTLGEARAGTASANATYIQSKANLERQRKLRAEGIGSMKSFLAAQAGYDRARAALNAARARMRVYGGRGRGAATAVTAALSGEVIKVAVSQGMLVQPGQHLYLVSDLDEVWVVGRVYEQDIAAVKAGLPATIEVHAYPGRVWRGTVGYVASTLDEKTRTLSIRVPIPNKDHALKPGLFATITLPPAGRAEKPVVVVPEQAVQRVDGLSVVFVPGAGEGEFNVRPIRAGRRVLHKVEVLAGVQAGDKIVVSGTFTLKSELLRSQLAAEE